MTNIYLILIHKIDDQLIYLLDSLDGLIYIHPCKSMNREIVIASKKTVRIVKRRYNGRWGGFGIVEATIESMRQILTENEHFSHITLLSGADVATKSTKKYHDLLNENKGKSFMHYWDFFPFCEISTNVEHRWHANFTGHKKRLQNYYYNRFNTRYAVPPLDSEGYFQLKFTHKIKHFLKTSGKGFTGSRREELFQLLVSFFAEYPRKIPLKQVYGASQWWTMARAHAEYVVSYHDSNKEIRDFFKKTMLPDESYIQTILLNSEFHSDVVNDNLRYIKFPKNSNHPQILTVEDLELISADRIFFARKIDFSVDSSFKLSEALKIRIQQDDLRAKTDPLVTVLMSVYNGERYLRDAIESILSQTYTNFEFLIINDGSSDKSEEIICSYSDKRIRYIRNSENLKLIASLNKGIDLALGKYIARIDADDIALPTRIEKQVDWMEKHPQIGVLGTFVETIGLDKNYEIHFLTDHANIRAKLFFNNYIHHPTVLIRRDVLLHNQIRYETFLHAEDYLLWLRLAKVTEIEIIPEILLKYRMHQDNISKVHQEFQRKQTEELRKMQLNELDLFPDEECLRIYNCFIDADQLNSTDEFDTLILFLEEIVLKNRQLKCIHESLLFDYYFKKINNFVELNCWRKNIDFNSYYKSIFTVSALNNLKLKIKKIVRLKSISWRR